MKSKILLIALLASGAILSAQPLNRPTYAMMISMAEEQMERQDYYRALEWYEKAYDESKDKSLAIIIADMNYMLRDYADAAQWYGRAFRKTKKGPEAPEEKRFEYAQSLKQAEKYDEAVEQFNEFIAKTTDPVRKELAEIEKIGCEFARVAKPQDGVNVLHGGKDINTKNSEYAPWLTNDNKTMYFSGAGTDDLLVIEQDSSSDQVMKIYTSNRGDKGWSKPTALDEGVNRIGWHNVGPKLSPDGKRMYFNRSLMKGNVLQRAIIYMSENKGGSWSPAEEVKGLNTDSIAKSPCVGELFGNEVLFFASNKPGGKGGYDILYATYKGNGQYGDPVPLSERINTVGDEDHPFYRDGVLYFSSTGHPGIGGYDIFMSTWNGTSWSKPQNLGKPYNSPADDEFFMLDQEGYHGFLTSNRISEGAKSLKSKTSTNDIFNVVLKKITADVVALTYDVETKAQLTGATVQLVEVNDGTPKVLTSKTNSAANNFDFPLELDKSYMLIALADNYTPDTVTFTTVGLFDSKTFNEKLELKPGKKFRTVKREEPFTLENIYYDFDDDKILAAAEGDLKVLADIMKQYPDMVIELSSHTDARGADEYNRNLSQRRAESARRWLMQNAGITRNRIEAKGYGESMPKTVDATVTKRFPFLKSGDVLTEDFINKFLPDSTKFEAAHQVNRRTEFKIIAGPTSIIIEEEQLIQIGNRQIDPNAPQQPDKQQPKKDDKKKPNPPRRSGGNNNNSPGGDSTQPMPKLQQLQSAKDSLKIDKLSSLYGKKSVKGLPVMQFKERVFDMGKVKKGELREHTFTYVNAGDVPLEIDIISVCECTSYEYSPSVVQPGGTGKIKVVFDSNKKEGEGADSSDVDIYLKNIDPEIDAPIFERVKFTFDIVK